MNKKNKNADSVFFLLLIAVTLFIGSIPYIGAANVQTPEFVFNGSIIARQDYAVYQAMMQSGKHGEWRNRSQFTHEFQRGVYVRQFYILLGHVFGKTDTISGFNYARLIFGATSIAAIKLLADKIFRSKFRRRLVVLLAVFASGLGWLQLALGLQFSPELPPADFGLLESYPFLALISFPHYSASITILTGTLAVFLANQTTNKNWKSILGIILGLAGAWVSPFVPILAISAMSGSFFYYFQKKSEIEVDQKILIHGQIHFLLFYILFLIPFYGYYGWVYSVDQVQKVMASQNITLSPPISNLFLGFAGLGILATVGVFLDRKKLESADWIMIFWLLGSLVLAYLPWNVQRRFLLGFSIPISFLSLRGLEFLWSWVRNIPIIYSRKLLFASILVLFLAFSPVMMVIGTTQYVSTRPPFLFDSRNLVRAVDWLKVYADVDEVVLANNQTAAQLIAARAGIISYWGHPIETLYAIEKEKHADEFFKGNLSVDWLQDQNIDWVILEGSSPRWTPSLEKVYGNETVSIFRVDEQSR